MAWKIKPQRTRRAQRVAVFSVSSVLSVVFQNPFQKITKSLSVESERFKQDST